MKKTDNADDKKTMAGAEPGAGEIADAGMDVAKMEALESKNAELINDLQRTRADFENYRKQVEMQKESEKKVARLQTIYKMLGLIDDLGRAFSTYTELVPLEKSLTKTLKELGLEKIATEGEFDPDLHDAVMVEGDGAKEVIAEVLRPGYYYEGEVLRPAMVKVKKM